MQRRLIVALVGVALASVLLVGAGVLILAQIGARAQTESKIDQDLGALAELMASSRPGDGRSQEGLRGSLNLDRLDLVAVDSQGNVYRLEPGRGRPRERPLLDDHDASLVLTLESDAFERFRGGETILEDRPRGGLTTVTGLRMINYDPSEVGYERTLGLMATKSVVTVGRDGKLWFALSAATVVGLSVAVAWLLARRLTKPILAIEQVTASIAAGDFTARVGVEGNDELAGLGRSVNRMAADLARSKALDQQFLMSVSHDLRTPLTAIAGYAEALSDGAVDDPIHAGNVIGNHADRLERLVGDLLDLAKLDANRFQLHLQAFDIGVAVGRTVAGLVPSAERFGLELTFASSGPLMAQADPDRLAQVVANVVDNAIKFARSHVATSVSPNGTHALIEISDDGPGILPEDLPHVFERLYVSSSQPTRAENPNGMGLAIVRELTTAMGGSVAASAGPDGGTIVTLRVPLAAPLLAPP